MKIILGSDHGGFKLKEYVKSHLILKSIDVIDVGCFSEESVDYPDIALELVRHYRDFKDAVIFAFCGTGIGISIALNKFDGIYCALIYNENTAKLAKEHNNANAIAMGGRELDPEVAVKMVDNFLNAKTLNENHERRREKIGRNR